MEESASAKENKTDGEEAGFRIVNGIKLPPKKTIVVHAKDLSAIESSAAESKKVLVEDSPSNKGSDKGFEWEWLFMVLGMVYFALFSPRIAIFPVCAIGFLVASIATARYLRGGRSLAGVASAMGMLFFLTFAIYVQSKINNRIEEFTKGARAVQAEVKNAAGEELQTGF